MDVKACDNCKKLNTEVSLYRLREARTSQGRGQMSKPTDPLTGFSFSIARGLTDEEIMGQIPDLSQTLCKACAEKTIAEFVKAL